MHTVLRLLAQAWVVSLAAACSSAAPTPPAPVDSPPPDASADGLVCNANQHVAAPLSLLTRTQYDATISDLLGDDSQPSLSFPAENQVSGYSNNTEVHIANPLLVEQFMGAAEGIAGRAVAAHLDTLAPCAGTGTPERAACGANFVSNFGKRAFRRPLTSDEALSFNTLFSGLNATRSYSTAVELTMQAILQSPQFLYRVDSERAPTPETGAVALDSYQLASRLSYFLTNSMPDAQLLAAADANALSSTAEIETQARRLLETKRARDMVRDFNQQWLQLDQLSGLARNPPDGTTDVKGIGADYRESLQRFLDQAFWERGDLRSLLLSPVTFVNARLAGVLGVASPATDFASVTDAPGRFGLLSQPGLMAMLAHSDQSGPVQRGVFVRQRILCLDVPPPPANFNPIPPDPDPSLTTRERFAVHTASSACSGCHKLIDGTGFGFENYDQLGRYRTEENGLPVDASGEMLLTGERAVDGEYSGVAELSNRLAVSPRVERCLATNWYRYAMGRVETEADGCSLREVQQKFSASGGQFKELLVAVVLTDAFRYRPAIPGDQ
ncbi:MAG TPA: DUF1592 domain-containing protein [Polyangiaceae bacterium]|nr:DUF1592 domain-containing protein [Polyangiaceae bacterium]